MKLRLACGLACALGLALPVAADAATPSLVGVARVHFPYRGFVLQVPGHAAIDPSRVKVFENGEQVANVTVTHAQGAGKGKFGLVLVLDESNSMRGKPIAGALDAARIFAQQLGTNEQLALITFNRSARVALAPTIDASSIKRAFSAKPQFAEGTFIYDAVDSAITMLTRSKVAVGSVVVLSDGRDTGSRISAERVIARAQQEHVRVFTVGLRSYQFRSATLSGLAEATGARYSEARSPAALAPIYRALSTQLKNEYLVQYRSLAGPAKGIQVRVAVAGFSGFARASYVTPALPKSHLPPFHRSLLDRFWRSGVSVLVVSLLVGLLVWIAILYPLSRRPASLAERMRDFVSFKSGRGQREVPREHAPFEIVERALARTAWWERFKDEVEIAKFPVQPAQLVVGTVFATAFAAFLLAIALPPVFMVFALLVPLVPRAAVKRKLRQRRDEFAEQLPDNLNVLAASLRTGHSFVGALSVVLDAADEPSKSELRRVVADDQLGVAPEDSLVEVARRMANGDLEQIALVAALQRQTGGNTAEVLDTVVDTIRERFELRRLVKTLTAQGRMARWILTLLPVGLALFITLLNPSYISPLFHRSAGQVMLAIGLAMLIAGSIALQKIMDIEV